MHSMPRSFEKGLHPKPLLPVGVPNLHLNEGDTCISDNPIELQAGHTARLQWAQKRSDGS